MNWSYGIKLSHYNRYLDSITLDIVFNLIDMARKHEGALNEGDGGQYNGRLT